MGGKEQELGVVDVASMLHDVFAVGLERGTHTSMVRRSKRIGESSIPWWHD